MAEMNSISRFFVNRSAARRSAKRYRWIRENVAIPKGAACLEIGCGNGAFATRFVEGFRPERYVATDLDPRQLKEATQELKKRFPNGLPANLELRPADMLHLPFPDASFTVVLTFVALHHAGPTHTDFTNVADALSEIDRVLRPGGLLIYSELFHKDLIRKWLAGHRYSIAAVQVRWRLESVAVRKFAGPG